MGLPGITSLPSYGGALSDYSPVADSTTDRSATGTNPAYADVAAMTHSALRAWTRMTLSASAPALVAWDATWKGNVTNVAPTLARSGVGTNTITYAATVFDEIPNGSPGYTAAGFLLNLRAAFGTDRTGASALWHVRALVTSANVITVYTWNAAGALADMGSIDVDIWGF